VEGPCSHTRLIPPLKYQIICMLSEPCIEFVSLSISKLKHDWRFERGGCCKKIRAVCEAKNAPKPERTIKAIKNQINVRISVE